MEEENHLYGDILVKIRAFTMQNPSKPQIELYERVKEIFENAKLNYPFGRYFIDVAIPNLMIAIEYDGGYLA